jgi:D-alanine-D-alanine ligase
MSPARNSTVIGIVHNQPVAADHPHYISSADVLVQVDEMADALTGLGHSVVRLPFTRDLKAFLKNVQEKGVGRIINLCESVDEDPLLAGHPPAVFDLLNIPYSGSSPLALMLTGDKLQSKRLMIACGVPTPKYRYYDGGPDFSVDGLCFPVLVKPSLEDASIGIDQESVFRDQGSLQAGLPLLYQRYGSLLVEEYIKGREFNVSVFGFPTPRTLPVAEIDFSGFPRELHHIVGYRAKWDENSFEYKNTRRLFPEESPENYFFPRMKEIALRCFHLFDLRDYGRVDIRVDTQGQIYVLEVNANPCLSSDAGFVAAAEMQGMRYVQLVEEFVRFLTIRKKYAGTLSQKLGQ